MQNIKVALTQLDRPLNIFKLHSGGDYCKNILLSNIFRNIDASWKSNVTAVIIRSAQECRKFFVNWKWLKISRKFVFCSCYTIKQTRN